ncbi:MAG: helix-turn-helix transcriptional regulator [Deltaproteobacteria bacterium]|nr:helix-turn-helix transcriptional regulator [Deltaproteobacteria bacterium]
MDAEQKKFFVAFGKKVRQLRLSKNMTLEDMQDHGFSPQHFQKIETGKKAVNLYTAHRISIALGVGLGRLI